MKKEISIIIPVYNGASHIKRCIDSVLSQDYIGCQIIIVDDGSTDDTLEICYNTVGQNKYFVILHQENQGVSAARNTGLTYAKKEWTYFLDADDELDTDALEYMRTVADSSYEWIIMNYRKHVEGTEKIFFGSDISQNEKIYYSKAEFAELLNSGLFMYPCGKLYKTAIIKKHEICFPLNIVYGEDIRFNLLYFCYVEKYRIDPFSAFIYHIRQGEGAGSAYYENAYQMQMDIDEEILKKVYGSYKLDRQTLQEINQYFFKQGINIAFAYLTIWKQLPFKKRYHEIQKIMKDTRFKLFMKQEWESGRLHKIDYFLLRNEQFFIYYGVHVLYVLCKKVIQRGKEK